MTVGLPTFSYIWLINKLNENEIILREQNIFLKCCQPFELFIYFGKGFRSLHAGNVGSFSQMAAKLLVVKFGVLKNKSVILVITAEVCASGFSPATVGPGSNHSSSLKDGNFAAL